MTPPAPRPFRIDEQLPSGRLAIEASAGTGKTFTLAALATRFLAEREVRPGELLLVTFTRAATAELRGRVRDRVRAASDHLAADDPPQTDDPLLVHLAKADRAQRRERLQRALVDFDAATVATIHGFAAQVLGTLGATAGTDPGATIVADDERLAADACADVLANAAIRADDATALPEYAALLDRTRVALRMPDVALAPEPGQRGATPADLALAELVRESIASMRRRRRRGGTRSFSEILTELRDALRGSGRASVIDALRTRFKVALIDEFQDTDPVQWDIFSILFGEADAGTSLVLVGDPKQSIYGFRGADVHTYLDAVADGTHTERRSLTHNWRSDAAMLQALGTLLEGATFGDPSIAFEPVLPVPEVGDRRLWRPGSQDEAEQVWPSLSLRLALGPDLPRNQTRSGTIRAAEAMEAIARDLVARIRELLDHGQLPEAADGSGRRDVRPSDVAVLVRSGREAATMHRALADQGVPAVLARAGSVLDSPAAKQWRWLLDALVRPADPARARAFALSWFGGWDPARVDAADDDELSALQDQLHTWAETLAASGATELVRHVIGDSGVLERTLQRPDGDRVATDLEHVGELLASQAGEEVASAPRLLALLQRDQDRDADPDVEADPEARRIESEAQAVQVMTVWNAKGLEFPIVCCPTLWKALKAHPVITHDPDTGRRVYDLAGGARWPTPQAARERKRRAMREAAGEDLRVAYVALTRARHHLIVWWSRGDRSETSALARLLFARRSDGSIDPAAFDQDRTVLPTDDQARDVIEPVIARAAGTITTAVHGLAPRPQHRWRDPARRPAGGELDVARFEAPPRWRSRWSFTAITGRAEAGSPDPFDPSLADAGADDEQAPGETADGTGATAPLGTRATDVSSGPVPLAALPAGAAFGTLVHELLERVDFTDDDLEAALSRELDRRLRWRPLDLAPDGIDGAAASLGRQSLVAGLRAAIHTPLGPLFDGRRLADLPRRDRLDEVSFELRLGEAGHRPSERDIGHVVQAHVPVGDPLAGWASSLAAGAFDVTLAGHLTGSIDIVARTAGRAGEPRFVVIDHKTNRLNERGRPAADDDYHPARLAEAMAAHHYPLQALLYLVALHRYLRWRLPGYDAATHLGGAAYLFLRGMTGPEVARHGDQPHGVFTWAPPAGLVEELSDLLDGRARSARGTATPNGARP